jgi:hypothetical protein
MRKLRGLLGLSSRLQSSSFEINRPLSVQHQLVKSRWKPYSQGSGQDTIPNTNVPIDSPPPPKQSDYAFSGIEGAKNENLYEPNNKGPSVSSNDQHPPPKAEGGAAFIPNSNVEVSAPPPPTSSDSAFAGSSKVMSPSRKAISYEEGMHSERDRDQEMKEAVGSKEERSSPGLHSGD